MSPVSCDLPSISEQQRKITFHTRCHVYGKVLFVTIDGGSCINIVSTYVVEKLGLKTKKLSNPYKLQGLNDVEQLMVTEQVLVPFSIGRYKDEVLCDVLPMSASHIILGRPWQYDKRVTHDGFANQFSFMFEGRKIILTPLSPSQVQHDQEQLSKRIAAWSEEKKERKCANMNMFAEEKERCEEEKVVGFEKEKVEKNIVKKREEKETQILSNPISSSSSVLQDDPRVTSFHEDDSKIVTFGRLKDVSFEAPVDMTFGEQKDVSSKAQIDMTFGNSQEGPIDVSRVMPFEVQTVAFINIPSAIPIFKKIQQPKPIKHPPWFAISFHLTIIFPISNHGLICSKVIYLCGIILSIYDDKFLCHFKIGWCIRIKVESQESFFSLSGLKNQGLSSYFKDIIRRSTKIKVDYTPKSNETIRECLLTCPKINPLVWQTPEWKTFDLRTNRLKEGEDDTIQFSRNCKFNILLSLKFPNADSKGVLPYFVFYYLIYTFNIVAIMLLQI